MASSDNLKWDEAAHKALRESEERYRRIVETAAEGVCVIDADGIISFANSRMGELLGRSIDELVGNHIKDFTVPEEREDTIANIERLRAGEQSQFERTLVRSDGGEVKLLITTSPFFDEDGEFRGALGMMTDITERKRLEHQLEQARRIEAVGGLAGGIAHDFNNSMMAIRGLAELLIGRLEPGDPRRRDAEGIKQAADGAASLTRQLLAFGRRQVLRPEKLDVNDIVRALEPVLRRKLGDELELRLSLGEGVGKVSVDPGQLEEVILELAENARDAMPEGGRLTIETAEESPTALVTRHASLVEPGPYTMIAVRDEGTGIPGDVSDHVFEPFFTTKELGKGTGMGLPTVYGVVKQSGGYLAFETEVGQGSTFKVYLPVLEEDVKAGAEDRSGTGETVLLVEDDEIVRAVVAEMLEELGYRVLEADGADAALVLVANNTGIDILLTDVVMRGLSGPELAAKLIALRPGLRVLYMSGYTAGLMGRNHWVLDEDVAFLQKPFSVEALRDKLRALPELPGFELEGAA